MGNFIYISLYINLGLELLNFVFSLPPSLPPFSVKGLSICIFYKSICSFYSVSCNIVSASCRGHPLDLREERHALKGFFELKHGNGEFVDTCECLLFNHHLLAQNLPLFSIKSAARCNSCWMVNFSKGKGGILCNLLTLGAAFI